MFTFIHKDPDWVLYKDGAKFWIFSDYIADEIADAEDSYGQPLTLLELRALCDGDLESLNFAIRDGVQEDWNKLGQTMLTDEEIEEAAKIMAKAYAEHYGIGKLKPWVVEVAEIRTVRLPVLAETEQQAKQIALSHQVLLADAAEYSNEKSYKAQNSVQAVEKDGLYNGFRFDEFVKDNQYD